MRTKKFRSVVCIALSILLVMSNLVYADTAKTDAAKLPDIVGSKYEVQLREWVDNGFIKGNPDGTFKPNNTITRAEFMALVNRSFGFTETMEINYTDVSKDKWFYKDAAIATKAGYMKGNNGRLTPQDSISRQEFATVLARLTGNAAAADIKNIDTLTDSKTIPEWSKAAISIAISNKYFDGLIDKSFKPTEKISRLETVVALDRAFKSMYKAVYMKKGTYGPATGTQTLEGSAVIISPDVTLKNTTINGDLILRESIGDGNAYLDNVVVKGTTIVKGGGANSIVIRNSSLGRVVVRREGNVVRIVATGSTTIGEVNMQSGATLQEEFLTGAGFGDVVIPDDIFAGATIVFEGAFDDIQVDSANANINVGSGTIGNLTLAPEAAGTTVNLSQQASVGTLNLNAAVNITGQGTIQTANVNASGSTIQQQPQTTVMAPGVTMGNPPQTTPAPTPTPRPTTGGGSGGGGGGNDDDDDYEPVSVSNINVSSVGNITTVIIGSTLQLNAAVAPADATNKSVRWSVADGADKATISANGLLTPIKPGIVTVKATAKDGSGKFGTIDIVIREVPQISGGKAEFSNGASVEGLPDGASIAANPTSVNLASGIQAAGEAMDFTFTGNLPAEGLTLTLPTTSAESELCYYNEDTNKWERQTGSEVIDIESKKFVKATVTHFSIYGPLITTAKLIADNINSVTAPEKDATILTLPVVDAGYTIAVKSSSKPDVVAVDGTVIPPSTDQTVELVFTVTKTSDNSTADTASINVVVPAKKPVIQAGAVNAANATTVTFSSNVDGAAIKWNGVALSAQTVIGANTITVPLMVSGENNILVIEKSGYTSYTNNAVVWIDTLTYLVSPLTDWVNDRTEPNSWELTDNWIKYSTKIAPANQWYAWHGKKTTTNNAVSDNWKVETEFRLTEELLGRDGVRTSMWLNVLDEFGNNVDWSILQFKIEKDTRTKGWQYWNSDGDGAWLDIAADLPTTAGVYKLAIYYADGNVIGYINGIEVFKYAKSESKLTSVKEVIYNSYSFGESYTVEWKVPTVSYVKVVPEGTVYVKNAAELNAALNGSATTIRMAPGSYALNSQIRINKALDIIGAGDSTIITKGTAPWTNTTGSKGYAPLITINSGSNAVKLENIKVTGAANIRMTSTTDYGSGINVVSSSNVTLNNVTSTNNAAAGLIVNSSTVTANNLNTSGNGWYGVNVDKADSVAASFTLAGDGIISEDIQIKSDKTSNVTVTAAGYNAYKLEGTAITIWNNKPLKNVAAITNSGTTLYYPTIRAAIDAAVDGDTVNVAAGTYDIGKNQLLINKGITIRGIGDTKPVIRGTAYDVGSYTEPMLKTIANNTEGQETLIENLSFEWQFENGFTSRGNGNAAMLAGNNVTVRDSEFKGINIPVTQYVALVSIGQTGGTVGPNVEANKVIFEGNTVDGTISVVRSAQGKVLNAEIKDNTINPVNMEGIWTYVLSADDILTISGNTITDVPSGFTAIKLMEEVASVNGNADYTKESISAANNGATVKLNWVSEAADVESLKSAIAGAKAGDTILMAAGDYTITETINVNKAIRIKGAAGFATKITTTGGNPVFNLSAAATLESIFINKTDKLNQHLVTITANGATVKDSKFVGKYVQDDDEVVRAIAPNAGITGYTLGGNYFESVRQPAYLEGVGTVVNNFVKNTRGWVVTVNHAVNFEGNSFEGNAVDIAVIANGQSQSDNYTDIAAISEANNGAYVENQLIKASAKNGRLVVEAGENVYINSIQNAVAAANEGDTIILSAGKFEGFRISNKKDLTITGAGPDSAIIKPTALIASGIRHKYTDNMKVAVVVDNSTGIVMEDLTISGNGLHPDAMVLWNKSTGRIEDSKITDTTPLDGVQTGQGIVVDGSTGTTALEINNTDISGFHKNAVDIVDGNGSASGSTANITVNMTGGTITGAGNTNTIAQNGLVFWDRAGGTLSGSVNGVQFEDLFYTGADISFALLDYRNNRAPEITVQNCRYEGVEGQSYPVMNIAVDDNFDSDTPYFGVAAFDNINDAIENVGEGGTINIAAGTYVEQISIDKDITIIGGGKGTIIQAPDSLVNKFTTSAENRPVIFIGNDAAPTIENLVVDGAGKGNANYRIVGIGIYNSGGTIDGVEIKSVRNTPLDGIQHGVGIYAYNDDNAARQLTVKNSTIYDYQKNGMALSGKGLEVDVNNNTVTGMGETQTISQNGIQVSYGAGGSVTNNTISGHQYTKEDIWKGGAAGILLYQADVVYVSDNTFGTGANKNDINVSDSSIYDVNNSEELLEALADKYVKTININADIALSETAVVNRPMTINGNGKTVTGPAAGHGIEVLADNVEISNLTVTGSGRSNMHFYVVTGGKLTNVTLSNAANAGLIVNGSEVTISGVTTANNAWGGINVDQGENVTAIPKLTVENVTIQTSPVGVLKPAIWLDKGDNTAWVEAAGMYEEKKVGDMYFFFDKAEYVSAEKAIAITAAVNAITALPEVSLITLDNEDEIIAARELVEAAILKGAADADITNLEKLTAAEAKIVEILLTANVSAGDFGVMELSGVIGYNVGFNLINSNASHVDSIVVELYNGETLLAANTTTGLLANYPDATGLSAPFDVLGTFDYATDGNWQYSEWTEETSIIPDKAEITVTFKNGLEKTAVNTTLTGDTSIFTGAGLGGLSDIIIFSEPQSESVPEAVYGE